LALAKYLLPSRCLCIAVGHPLPAVAATSTTPKPPQGKEDELEMASQLLGTA